MARPTVDNTQDTKNLALDAMGQLIQEFGYNGVSMNALAQRIGVRKASLYHHFPDGKEQLVANMIERMIHKHGQGYQAVLDRDVSVKERLEHVLQFSLAANSEVSHVVTDSLRFLHSEQRSGLWELFQQNQYQKIKRVLDDGVASGELRRHETTISTWMFLSLMRELGVWESFISDQDFSERVVSLFLEGVRKA
ncbi:MAG: TetR/AcrR family transcriptional regulator [Deinococcota bacterium]